MFQSPFCQNLSVYQKELKFIGGLNHHASAVNQLLPRCLWDKELLWGHDIDYLFTSALLTPFFGMSGTGCWQTMCSPSGTATMCSFSITGGLKTGCVLLHVMQIAQRKSALWAINENVAPFSEVCDNKKEYKLGTTIRAIVIISTFKLQHQKPHVVLFMKFLYEKCIYFYYQNRYTFLLHWQTMNQILYKYDNMGKIRRPYFFSCTSNI